MNDYNRLGATMDHATTLLIQTGADPIRLWNVSYHRNMPMVCTVITTPFLFLLG